MQPSYSDNIMHGIKFNKRMKIVRIDTRNCSTSSFVPDKHNVYVHT
jgi:argininosuccinate lyase